MFRFPRALSILALLALTNTPAAAVDGEIVITQDKALAGGITPGDTPGFPITITKRGAYRLASPLQVPLSKNGIEIYVRRVTIDFAGFSMTGAGKAVSGIVATEANITVKNGEISSFGQFGIFGQIIPYWFIENMTITANGSQGILVGPMARISRNMIADNGYGVYCNEFCNIEGNIIVSNGSSGIYIKSGTILGNTILGQDFAIDSLANVPTSVGFGNNTINGQVRNATALQPNSCDPACP